VRNGASIDDALASTVDRLSRAARLGNRSALALQGRTADGLRRSLLVASATERRLGARVAAMIRSAGVAGHLTAAESAAGIADITRRLARRGIPRSRLPAKALAPQPVTLLTVFTL
jgi:hypothetical protein